MPQVLTEQSVQQLTERIHDWRTADVQIDESERIVRNVALTGLKSKNGYRYSEQSLREGAPLYENKPIFLDHAANSSRPYDRSTRDLVGSIVNPRYEEGRIRSDIQTLDTEAGRTFLALARASGPAVGMSHVVMAQRSSDNSVVEKIREVVSVDAVAFPATTSTFREQTHDPDAGSDASADDSSLHDEQRNELQAELDRLTAEYDRLLARSDDLEVERTAVEQRHRTELLLRESQLPPFAVTEMFRRQLSEAANEKVQRALISEREELVARCRQQPPLSRERPANHESAGESALIAAIKRRRPSVLAGIG